MFLLKKLKDVSWPIWILRYFDYLVGGKKYSNHVIVPWIQLLYGKVKRKKNWKKFYLKKQNYKQHCFCGLDGKFFKGNECKDHIYNKCEL